MLKFVIGLTDTDSDAFHPNPDIAESYDGLENLIDKNVYALHKNDTAIERTNIEWMLDDTLPAVTNLLTVLDAIKSGIHMTLIHCHKYRQNFDLYDTDFLIEIKNLLPNLDLVLPEYTQLDYDNMSTNECSLELDSGAAERCANINDNEFLVHAMETGDYTFLKEGPTTKFVYPAFRINFRYNVNDNVTNKTMSAAQQEWMINNKDLLESKGYYISDSRNRIGALKIGQLIGTYEDAFAKAQQYSKICRVEIIRE
jgi:hypothetical protein